MTNQRWGLQHIVAISLSMELKVINFAIKMVIGLSVSDNFELKMVSSVPE
ncbi:hypothetical protein KDW_31500 [Dictyobacter vulcani]|uniref:Uncharacterized protein n=1 Tax=Dictyobacter vulcani TaxID=2607529 RepID=A0A5J4KH12_9CHLR|nr:hypothetical protein KDW_31500 [Dictyobacter vulcani]